jgi:uncharacterized protein YbjT (DUF2867 family)
MSTITILGATGKVGSKPVNNLLDKGHTLRLIARHADSCNNFQSNKEWKFMQEIHSTAIFLLEL